MKKHSVTLRGHRTSISLEEIFWKELRRVAESDKKPLQKLIEEIDRARTGSLSSALRIYVVRELMKGK